MAEEKKEAAALPPLSYTMRFEEEDMAPLAAYQRRMLRQAVGRGKFIYSMALYVGTAVIFALLLLFIIVRWGGMGWVMRVVFLVLLVIVGLLAVVRIRRMHTLNNLEKMNAKELLTGLSYDITLDESGLRSVRSDGEKDYRVGWSLISGAVETDGLYLLRGQGQLQLMTPKRCLEDTALMDRYIQRYIVDEGKEYDRMAL